MAADDEEIRLVHGPFICRPLLFDGKRIVLKGLGRRAQGPGRRVILIFSAQGSSSACVTVSGGSVSFEECVLTDGHDGESMTMSSVQARIKLLDRAMGRHPVGGHHAPSIHALHSFHPCFTFLPSMLYIPSIHASHSFHSFAHIFVDESFAVGPRARRRPPKFRARRAAGLRRAVQ
jgi:hypothetical protein